MFRELGCNERNLVKLNELIRARSLSFIIIKPCSYSFLKKIEHRVLIIPNKILRWTLDKLI
ncbi:MAG: hypothetical protein DRR19_14445 [Candidatus Parabeggiatoa sp. nov. 1]|nr:MAG: hypothetical protein DRR19_14445 [Gammaproteobacteria bacterium]